MGEAYSHKKDNQKPAAKPALKPAPEVSAECAKSRQETGMTIADDLSTPQTPKQKEQAESEKVNDYFKKMKEEFLALGVELPVDFYKGAYYTLVKKEKRPAIELVYGRMNMFFLKARESVLAKTILHDRSKDLLKILEFHLLGKTDEALKHEVELFDNIDTKISINNIETTIGTKFSDKQAKEFLSLLNSNGIDSKTANKYIGEIKKMSPENFNALKGSQDLFIQHLLVLMLTLKAVGPNAKDFVKAELEIAAKFTQEFIANKRITNKKYLDQKQAKIDAPYNAAHFEMAQALTVNRRELAINYLRKSGKKIKYENAKTVINEIFQAKNSNDIKNLSQKYQIEMPATLGVLQNAESKFETANIDKLVGGDKGEVEEKLALESDKLIDVSDKLATRIDAEALYFENLLAKYSDISAVPAKEKRTTAIRLQGYLQLLNQHTVIQGRLLSIAASYDLMGSRPQKKPGDTETRPWETIVKEIREEAENSNNEAEMVAAFLKVEKYESPDLDMAALSPLTINLIQKENSGLEKKYKGIMNSVSGSYENLGNIMGQFEKAQADPDWAEKNGTKLVRIFRQGSEAYTKIIPAIEATRGKFENMKTDLASALAKVEKGDSPLLKLHPQLKKVYANILQNAIKSVNEILDNPNSPISTQQLKKLQDGQKEFEKARTAFLNGVLKKIGAFTIIMATSIVGAMGGAYLITTMLKTSSIFIVPIGTSLGGVIGSRVGMTITDTTGLTEYGAENIWNAKEMGKDFVLGYGLSLGALFAAKGTISALSTASHSKNATVAARASSMLKTIERARAIVSPFEIKNAKTALTRFGAKFGEEYAEETIEEGAGKLHPTLEFLVSVINASDGKKVKLNMAGVNTKKVGIATEGNTITYTTKTPEEFIANLSSQFAGRKGGSFDSKINPDGSVKLSIYGPSLRQSIAEMTIYPATQQNNILTAKNAEKLLRSIQDIHRKKIKTIGNEVLRTEGTENGIIIEYDEKSSINNLLNALGITYPQPISDRELKITVDNVELHFRPGILPPIQIVKSFISDINEQKLTSAGALYPLFFADLYADKPYRSQVLKTALERALEGKHAELIFAYANVFKQESYAAEIFAKASKLNPELAFKYADRYKGQPYAETILRDAADQNPRLAKVYGYENLISEDEAHSPLFDTPEKVSRIKGRVEAIIQDIIYHDVKVLFFLDRSARPVYWMIQAAWDSKKLGRPMPKVKFLNIGSEKKALLGTNNQPIRSDFDSDKAYEKAVSDHWGKLKSADYISKIRRDLGSLLTDEGVDVFGKSYKGKVMVIDDISITNVTQTMAVEFLEHHFPGIKVVDATLLNRYDEDVFPPSEGKMWTQLPWNANDNKAYTLMSSHDDPRAVTAKPELGRLKRQKGLGLRREIQRMFQQDPINHKKVVALSFAEKISEMTVRTTATEIANELFGGTVKSKDAFSRIAAKFKSISTYLKSNAKELATIFENKFKEQGVTFGMSGAQVLQVLYETVAEFAGKKVDIQKVNRKFKVGDIVMHPDVRGLPMEVFIKDINPQTGEVTLRTTHLSGYEVKVPAAGFLAFNKSRLGGFVSQAEINMSDYKIGDTVDVMRNGKIERGKWKIEGRDGREIAIRELEGGVVRMKTYVDLKDILPKKTENIVPNKPQENLDPVKRPLKGSQDVLNEAFRRSKQFELTEQLINDNVFVIKKTITLDGKQFHVGPVFKGTNGKLFCIMMVDRGNGKLFPRLMYQSTSGGCWMCTRGVTIKKDKYGKPLYINGEIDSVLRKGALKIRIGNDPFPAAYTETQVHPEIAEYLDAKIGEAKSYDSNVLEMYFDLSNPSVIETNTYSPLTEGRGDDTEVDFSPESSIISRSFGLTPQFMPGMLNRSGSERAAEHFRGLDNRFPQGFIPNFNEGPVRQPRRKYNSTFNKTIFVETYIGFLNGKAVEWNMAYEDPNGPDYQGRVWIENIRMANSGVTTYGTYANYLFTGVLGHKPLDYKGQVSEIKYGRDKKFFNSEYDDITPLLDNLLPIRLFRRARNIYRP